MIHPKLFRLTDPDGSTNVHEARAIWDGAVSPHTPIVAFPQPEHPKAISMQFIRSWCDFDRSCDLDTFWTPDHGRLIGIVITIGGRQRVFGSTEGIAGPLLHIGARDWVKEIKMVLDTVNILTDQSLSADRPERSMSIIGMIVELTSGKKKVIRSANTKSIRPFMVLEGMHLVGLTGEVDSVNLPFCFDLC
jgi:hypothetical protein